MTLAAACTCELQYVCVARTVSSLGTGGNEGDSIVAEMEPSHVLGRAAGSLIPIGQSGRGCWEQAVLENDLARGLRDGGVEKEEHAKGAHKGA